MGNFATTLRQLREQAGLTQAELAEKLGVRQSAISMYESSSREPNLATIKELAEFFGVDMNRMHGEENTSVKLDDFSFALYGEARELTPENKEKLLEMAQFFKEQQEKGKT
jgi:Predicted transcriptional regulator